MGPKIENTNSVSYKQSSSNTAKSNAKGLEGSVFDAKNPDANITSETNSTPRNMSAAEKKNFDASLAFLKDADPTMYKFIKDGMANGTVSVQAAGLNGETGGVSITEKNGKAHATIVLEQGMLQNASNKIFLATTIAHEGVHAKDIELINPSKNLAEEIKLADAGSVKEEQDGADREKNVMMYALNKGLIKKEAAQKFMYDVCFIDEQITGTEHAYKITPNSKTQFNNIKETYSAIFSSKAEMQRQGYDANKDGVIDSYSEGHGSPKT